MISIKNKDKNNYQNSLSNLSKKQNKIIKCYKLNI